MIALIAVNIGIPVVFLGVRLISHWVAPKSYGPAGGYDIFTTLVTGLHVRVRVHRGRRRRLHGGVRRPHRGHVPPPGHHRSLAPGAVLRPHPGGAGHRHRHGGGRLPHRLRGVRVRRADAAQLRRRERARRACRSRRWTPGRRTTPTRSSATSTSRGHGANGPPPNVTCGGQSIGPPPGTVIQTKGGGTFTVPAARIAGADPGLRRRRSPTRTTPTTTRNFLIAARSSLMVDVGLWIALEATIGFIVGLGLSSLMGQRTVAVILLIVLELILTPDLQPPRHHAPAQRRAGDRRRGHGPH